MIFEFKKMLISLMLIVLFEIAAENRIQSLPSSNKEKRDRRHTDKLAGEGNYYYFTFRRNKSRNPLYTKKNGVDTFVGDVSDLKLANRIIGGEPAKIAKYPSWVAIFRFDRFHCGGNLVSRWHVLTAAHCLMTKRNGAFWVGDVNEFWLRIGSHYYDEGGEHNYVRSIYVHPEFMTVNRTLLYRDVAIIRLSSDVVFGKHVAPATIYPELIPTNVRLSKLDYRQCVTAGWGSVNGKGPESFSRGLRDVELTVIPAEVCLAKYAVTAGVDPAVHICTFDKNKDTCQGDSGGGLFCEGMIVAVTSWGYGCAADLPGVFARVDNVRNFIEIAIRSSRCESSPNFSLLPLILILTSYNMYFD